MYRESFNRCAIPYIVKRICEEGKQAALCCLGVCSHSRAGATTNDVAHVIEGAGVR